jgi:hypothetical protein
MHKRLFTFVLLFMLFFGLGIGSKLGFQPRTSFVTATLPETDSILPLLLNPDLNIETNNWVPQMTNEGFELISNPLADLNFNQAIDKAIAPSLLPDIGSDILSQE